MRANIRLVKTKKDILGLIEVKATTWADTYENQDCGVTKEMIFNHFNKKYTEEKKLEMYKSIKDLTRKNWIAKDNEKIIAWLGCSKDIEKQSGRFAIYVLPEYQGLGIGRRMLKKGFTWLSKMKNIEIGVIEYNPKAIALYKSLGFEFTGKKEDFVMGEFVGKNWILIMRKSL